MAKSRLNPDIELKPPLQQRSRDTLARIVNAAERLLGERSFEDVTVAEIVRMAHSSVGAFYARFPDKDALLDHLDDLHAADMIDGVAVYADDPTSNTFPIQRAVGEVMSFLVGYFKAHRGVLRALSVRARLHGEPRFAEATRHINSRLPELMRLIMSRRSEIAHPSPDLATYLGFVMVLSVLRERILFPETHPTHLPISDLLLADELRKAYLAYLGVEALDA